MTRMETTGHRKIRLGASRADDPERVARELRQALWQPELSLVLVFCSAEIDLDRLAGALADAFGDTPVVGCTTAGEISPLGYTVGGIVAASLAGPDFYAVAEPIDGLAGFTMAAGQAVTRRALGRLAELTGHERREGIFAMLLIDGLSVCEEAVVSALYAVLGEVPLFGGSAADALQFQKTKVLCDGAFRSSRAVLLLVSTSRPFRVFKTEHFATSAEKMVVTEADPARRIVSEINGEPAALEYARVVRMQQDELTPMIFAAHPVVVRVGGTNFVRSIQKVNDDGSLTFFCAIDEGIVLTVASGFNLAEDLERLFGELRRDIGPPELIIGCDCVLRVLEAEQKSLTARVGQLMAANSVLGFATFGEQFGAMHVNQTFTGVAIAAVPEEAPA